MVELCGLHRYFGSLKAVHDVSFNIERSQVFGFIGPNGAGKTTTMRVLATIDAPTRGDAYIDGHSVTNQPDRVRDLIGFMPDAFAAYPNMNCWEYLDFFARAYRLRGKSRRTAVSRVMAFTELNELAEKPVDTLSKGLKQRLCLARSLIHDPKVLIMDEPASGLDPRARIELRELIKLLADDGKAILISSHILTELAEMCDAVAIIELGKVIASGPVSSIRTKSLQVTEQPASVVEIRVLRDAMLVERWLGQQSGVMNVQVNGVELTAHIPSDENVQADLLHRLALANLPVVSFHVRQDNLENVFLALTKGKMQ